MAIVQYKLINQVAFIVFNSGRVNSLGFSLRSELYNNITIAIEDPNVKGIVIRGEGAGFSAGADIYEFNTPNAIKEPLLPQLISLIMNSNKVVVAEIRGFAFGGGFELALAAHYRIGFDDTNFCFPEVNLGLIPGAGGTQLLSRLIGIGPAAKVIVKAEKLIAEEAVRLGIINYFLDNYNENKVADFVLNQQLPQYHLDLPVKLRDFDSSQIMELTQWIKKRKRGHQAESRALEVIVKGSQLPLEEGLSIERSSFLQLMGASQFKALRSIFFSERALYPKIENNEFKEINTAAVIGGGLMGRGISINLANAGVSTFLVEQDKDTLEKALLDIQLTYNKMEEQSRITLEFKNKALSLIKGTIDYQEIHGVDIVIEAVYENMTLKQSIFESLDKICSKKTILVSNTSRLDINILSRATNREELFLGMHFFSPAHLMKLIEIVRGDKTSRYAIKSVLQLANRMKKIGIIVGVCDGFVGNRMLTTYRNEAMFILEEGASVSQVDESLYDFGMAMGPFTMTDMAGLDISWAARKHLKEIGFMTQDRDSDIGDRLCELGRFGQKTLAGYYRYELGSYKPINDPIVDDLIKLCSKEKGISRRVWESNEIIERTIYSLINEGFKILEEGIVDKASSIDLIYIYGYGFPAYRGGPMFYADTIGLPKILEKMQQFSKKFGKHWNPSKLLIELVDKNLKVMDYRGEVSNG